ncbi:Oidioi.mRNA.OKI2018_I69.XSR.g15342.t1.cds [Oikopleura dioica]|uniref:Oidioi.mRNA.OKI2018_I69.XSR.g15342.t1.cds n=1 Tax=Oikopleura dioica TaxID=34765 RepID=A0ABN7SHR3_OIKDI|nr:Oidioi.mRNA.OKI2018_I69.XSR.g15342.t1.cds [Oikopleura dioica]
MKTSFAALLGIIASEQVVVTDRTVPPKHPKNRLARLNLICSVIFEKTEWMLPARAAGLMQMCNTWSLKINSKIDSSSCFFYDAELRPHGGPGLNDNPAPVDPSKVHALWDTGKIQWGSKSRKRRSDFAEGIPQQFWFDSIWADGPRRLQTLDPSRDDYAHPDFFDAKKTLQLELEFCQDECDGDKRCAKSCVPNAKEVRGNGSRMRDRIERQGPWKSAKSLVTGFRKFGERYLSNCHGHRAGTHMNRRVRMIQRISHKFLKHCSHEQCSDEWLSKNRFNWGKRNLRTDIAG